MEAEEEVDRLFSLQYFGFIKKVQLLIGVWPYQSSCWAIFIRIFILFISISFLIAAIGGSRKSCGVDWFICIENVAAMLYTLGMLMKYSSMLSSKSRFENIYDQMARNWLSLTDPDDLAIMVRYSNNGKIYSIVYTAYMLVAGISFILLPAVPVVLDVFSPLNQSRPKLVSVRAEFLIDPYENSTTIYLYFLLITCSFASIIVCTDDTFCVIVHQILGIISVTKRRILNATSFTNIIEGNSYGVIVTAISLHQRSIRLVDILEESFTQSFMLFVTGSIAFNSVGAVTILGTDSTFNIIRFGFVLVGVLFHIFCLCFIAQKIIDYSDDLRATIYESLWYKIPSKSKNLLKFMMLRTTKPLCLTAGGFSIMGIHTFGLIVKGSMSYTTVLHSLN